MLRQLFTMLLLTFVCASTSFIIVFPLWKWASVFPQTYSIVILFLIALFFITKLVKSFLKHGAKVFFTRTIKVFLIVAGFSLSVFFILRGQIIFSLLSLVATIILYGIVNIVLRKKN